MTRLRVRFAAVVSTLALPTLLGCVHQELGRVREAQEAYDTCIAAHTADTDVCAPLLEALHAEQRRYEEAARTSWGCNTNAPDCPVER